MVIALQKKSNKINDRPSEGSEFDSESGWLILRHEILPKILRFGPYMDSSNSAWNVAKHEVEANPYIIVMVVEVDLLWDVGRGIP